MKHLTKRRKAQEAENPMIAEASGNF
jgi:hypothetical protein